MENTTPVSPEKHLSHIFALSRLLAILCVISAHVTIKSPLWVTELYSAIGSVGVVLFFIISGYYYKQYPFGVLCRKKLRNVVLLVCFALFHALRSVWFLLLAMVVNAVSLCLTALGYMQDVISCLHITNYLNVLNWVGFFAAGILLQRVRAEAIYRFIHSTRWLWMAASLGWTVFIVLTPGYSVGYFSTTGWAYELVSSLAILGLCSFRWKHDRLWLSLSAASYPIYLLHMMFTGILAKVYSLCLVTTLFSNVIVLLSVYLCIMGGGYLAKKARCEKLYAACVGMRG